MVLPLEGVFTLGALERPSVLMDGLNVRNQLAGLCESCLALGAVLHVTTAIAAVSGRHR